MVKQCEGRFSVISKAWWDKFESKGHYHRYFDVYTLDNEKDMVILREIEIK